jgi:hypothetical protein
MSHRCAGGVRSGKKVYCVGDAESQTTMELVLALVLVLDRGCEFEPHVVGVKDITL